jgi:hypothetical protein
MKMNLEELLFETEHYIHTGQDSDQGFTKLQFSFLKEGISYLFERLRGRQKGLGVCNYYFDYLEGK